MLSEDVTTYRGGMRAGTINVALVLAAALVMSACSGSSTESSTTTSTSSTTTTSTTSTTSPTSTSTSTTTTSLATGLVGDPALVEQAIDDAAIGVEEIFGVPREEIPSPDLTNPDPLVAMREILEFDIWVFQNAPRRGLIEVYTDPLTPAWETLFTVVERLSPDTVVFDDGGGLTISEIRLASSEEAALVPDEVREEAPRDVVPVWYVYSASPYSIVDPQGTVRESLDGWTDRTYLALLAPSPRGWLLHWEAQQ